MFYISGVKKKTTAISYVLLSSSGIALIFSEVMDHIFISLACQWLDL